MNALRHTPTLALVALLVASVPISVMAQQAAATDIDHWQWQFRYRLETVEQDSFVRDATASTLRARLSYHSSVRDGFSLHGELDYIAELFADDYNAGAGNTPGRTHYPVVADPDGADLNQLYLQYQRDSNRVRAGRQRLIFDNARFIGNVGWRQNEQTYDALSFTRSSGSGLEFTAAYVDNVNRIFGDDVAAGDHEQRTWLLNLHRELGDAAKFSLYAYDIENRDAAALSNTTLGARYEGKPVEDSRGFAYVLELAVQSDNGGPVDYDAHYYRLDLSASLGSATVYGGIESLEGDAGAAGRAFRTPLATLHAFNGWADQFLATPDAGLDDVFAGLKGKAAGWSWNLVFHDFTPQSGSGDFGNELDLSLSRKLGKRVGLLLKAADFNADHPAFTDTRKLWLQLSADY